MRGLEGPSQPVTRGEDIFLYCRYDLEAGDRLYAVMWFHGTREFYRFQPEMNPPGRSFPVDDVAVDASYLIFSHILYVKHPDVQRVLSLTSLTRRSSRQTPRNLSSAMSVRVLPIQENLNKLFIVFKIFLPFLQFPLFLMDGLPVTTNSSRYVGHLPL